MIGPVLLPCWLFNLRGPALEPSGFWVVLSLVVEMDLTEAEDIKRSVKNTQKNHTKKILMTHITTMV